MDDLIPDTWSLYMCPSHWVLETLLLVPQALGLIMALPGALVPDYSTPVVYSLTGT